jgi:PhnB protein
MHMNATVNPIPQSMHTVTPHLVCAHALAAIAFYKNAFGAVEQSCLLTPDGKLLHGMIRIGDSAIMLVEEMPTCNVVSPLTLKGSPVTLHLSVDNADKAFSRAVEAGATSVMAPADMFWGDRYGVLTDPFGHNWSVAHHVRDMSPEETQAAANAAFC